MQHSYSNVKKRRGFYLFLQIDWRHFIVRNYTNFILALKSALIKSSSRLWRKLKFPLCKYTWKFSISECNYQPYLFLDRQWNLNKLNFSELKFNTHQTCLYHSQSRSHQTFGHAYMRKALVGLFDVECDFYSSPYIHCTSRN